MKNDICSSNYHSPNYYPVKSVFSSNAEVGGVAGRGPSQVDSGLQLGVDPLVDGAAEDLAVVDVGVQDKVAGRVADPKVVLRDLGLGRVERALVSWRGEKSQRFYAAHS